MNEESYESLTSEDELVFAPEEYERENHEEYWKFLIVDDELDIHRVTQLVLDGQEFEGKGLKFYNAYNGIEACEILEAHPDIAVIMLDVVMESEDAGLRLVRYIREELNNVLVRIVLRTGQPGQAPEASVIRAYDINDYREKTELTSQKLFSTVYASIRAYKASLELSLSRDNLEQAVRERTKELEERSRELQASIRSVYEAMAKVAVLEERGRIARELHHRVGHTMTAAIVQLEAARRLFAVDAEQAVAKVELIQQLVRKGLEDIRSSVHNMAAEQEVNIEIHAEMKRIIEETQWSSGVKVDLQIDPLPPLDWYSTRIISHVVQEGLTNGIRHGRAMHFICHLHTVTLQNGVQELQLLLWNNGDWQDGAKPGFGLTTLSDQLITAGGQLKLQAGQSAGVELRASLPLANPHPSLTGAGYLSAEEVFKSSSSGTTGIIGGRL